MSNFGSLVHSPPASCATVTIGDRMEAPAWTPRGHISAFDDSTSPQPAALSARECEVLRTWVMTDSKSAAAQRLFISTSTVNTHITRIRQKYDDVGRPARTKAALVIRALQDGLIDMSEL